MRSLRFLLFFLVFFLSLLDHGRAKTKTYYGILELSPNASLKDIKKAYRRLALEHHPDRNKGNEEEKTAIFREISEAYEILSDENKRREYDRDLKRGRSSSGGGGGGGGFHRRPNNNSYQHRDPFSQFNDVFQNDPFFKDAFKDMDDLFGKRFFEDSNRRRRGNDNNRNSGGGWGGRIADMLGVNVQFTTTTTNANTGRRSSSSYNRQSGGHSSYTKRNTRTVTQNGQRITIQSLEKDGNKIEERYIGNKLVGRTINGIAEDVGRISSDGDL